MALIAVLITGAVLLYSVVDFPRWGDPYSPASTTVSKYYITHALKETAVPNIVTAVLADYRGFDTLLETVVIFCAAIAIIILLRLPSYLQKKERFRSVLKSRLQNMLVHSSRKILPVQKDVIITTACRILFPVVQLFAIYVVIHGHHSPGGGFQGGVIMGASFIMIAIAYNLRMAIGRMTPKICLVLAALGVSVYAAIGILCLALGGNFLDYEVLSRILPVNPVEARSLGILGIEIGVAFTVMAVMFSIYADLSSQGRLYRGL